jgi:hypothetical protein
VVPQNQKVPQKLLAEWSGFVTSIEQHYFTASLEGVYGTGVEGVEEDSEIPLSDVGDADRDLMRVGAMFRLCIFYENPKNGRPRRFSQVIFRRLPAYTADELEVAGKRGEERHRGLRVK